MSLPLLSIIAFAIAIIISCVSEINVGFLSIAFAFIIGVFFGGMRVAEVAAGFPTSLFLILVGVTLLFSQASVNGTLDKIAKQSVKLARGNVGMIPVIFFFLAAALATIGAGNIATTALLAPIAMAVAGNMGISGFLMTVAVCCGANSGALSPFAPTGVIANGLLARIGITGQEWPTFLNNFIAEGFVGLSGYLLLGGYKLFSRTASRKAVRLDESLLRDEGAFTWDQKLTLVVIGALLISVSFFGIDVGMGAIIGAVILTVCRATREEAAVKVMPWNVILMVCGVTVLISILEKKGGMDLFTSLLARFSTQTSVTGVMGFVTGLISVYSSSSGVVLPAFLPTIPGLIQKIGGGDPMAIASSVNVGAHLVDVSPLSTLGALCIANAAASEDRKALFNKLMIWGLSMSVVGALVCWVFFGLL
ncbi:MAG TPA: SLC13 family permease [Terriglobia bacterium]|nr:SLC13 family permease [Terriglobia bacterium]